MQLQKSRIYYCNSLIWFFHPHISFSSITGLSAGGSSYITVCNSACPGVGRESQATDVPFQGDWWPCFFQSWVTESPHFYKLKSICQTEFNQISVMWGKILKRLVDEAITIMFHLWPQPSKTHPFYPVADQVTVLITWFWLLRSAF